MARAWRVAGLLALAPLVVFGIAHAWPDEPAEPATEPFRALARTAPAIGADMRHWDPLIAAIKASSPQDAARHYAALWSANAFRSPHAASHRNAYPDFGPVLATQRAVLAEMRKDTLGPATLDWLERDLAFWRRALAGADVVMAKVAAIRAVEANLRARVRVSAPLPAVPPLSIAERSFRDALAHELGIDAWFVEHVDDFLREAGWRRAFIALPFRPRRTYNLHFAHNLPVLEIAELAAPTMLARYAARPPRLHRVERADYLLNLKGVWALEMADASHEYGEYMAAAHDLDALIALTNLALDDARADVSNPLVPGEPAQRSTDGRRLFFPSRPGPSGPQRLALEMALGEPSEPGK